MNIKGKIKEIVLVLIGVVITVVCFYAWSTVQLNRQIKDQVIFNAERTSAIVEVLRNVGVLPTQEAQAPDQEEE